MRVNIGDEGVRVCSVERGGKKRREERMKRKWDKMTR